MHRVICILAVAWVSAAASAETFEVKIPPRENEAFQLAHYRMWLPEGVERVRGVIVRQHGCGPGARQLGLEHADDIQWQALARRWSCALLGSQMWAPEEDCSTWAMPDDGSARAFLDALKALAARSKHPEIEHAPWALWGHSGGAIWVTNMTYRYPQRVIATFARSGGLTPRDRKWPRTQPAKAEGNPKAFGVPTLFCYGAKERVEGSRFYKLIQGVHDVFAVGRKAGAVWAVAAHPDSEHENSNSRLLAIRFFDTMIVRRLPVLPGAADEPARLNPVDRFAGFFADPVSKKFFSARGLDDDAPELSWLADENLARAWRQFVTDGTIDDTTPPPPPTEVRVERSGGKAVVTWHARADVESGVGRFEIYRDGEKIGAVGGAPVKRWNPDGHYHAWNYSDQPLAGRDLPAMRFEDAAAPAGARYEVVTVNRAGLASARAAAQ